MGPSARLSATAAASATNISVTDPIGIESQNPTDPSAFASVATAAGAATQAIMKPDDTRQ